VENERNANGIPYIYLLIKVTFLMEEYAILSAESEEGITYFLLYG
jgi:hypothetical protein